MIHHAAQPLNTRVFYTLVLLGYFGIMALLPAWYGWIAPPDLFPRAFVILLLGLPLFAPLRGILHARPYTVAWSLFLSLFYFTHGVVEAYSTTQARWLALLEVGLSLCWLLGGIALVRAHKQV